MPRCLGPLASVRARTAQRVANCPHEIQVFWPLIVNRPPSSAAAVRSDARSEPASGSEKPWHQISSAEQDRRHVTVPLLVGSEGQQRGADDVEADHVDELGRSRGGQLLVDDDLLDGRPAAAAEQRRPRAPDEARLVAARLPVAEEPDALVERVRHLGRLRAVTREEAPHLVAQRPFLVGEAELHVVRPDPCPRAHPLEQPGALVRSAGAGSQDSELVDRHALGDVARFVEEAVTFRLGGVRVEHRSGTVSPKLKSCQIGRRMGRAASGSGQW